MFGIEDWIEQHAQYIHANTRESRYTKLFKFHSEQGKHIRIGRMEIAQRILDKSRVRNVGIKIGYHLGLSALVVACRRFVTNQTCTREKLIPVYPLKAQSIGQAGNSHKIEHRFLSAFNVANHVG